MSNSAIFDSFLMPEPADDCLMRPAQPTDVDALVGLIHELALFEKLSDACIATAERLGPQLFGPRPAAEAIVAEVGTAVVGFALFFTNFSTFLAQPGLYLEDLYVQPAYRGRGIARGLMQRLAGMAVERGCGRFDWSVLDWNLGAIRFYEGMGAAVLPDWRTCRLTGSALQRLAGAESRR